MEYCQWMIVAPSLPKSVEFSRDGMYQGKRRDDDGLRNNLFNMEPEGCFKTRRFSSLAKGAGLGMGMCSALRRMENLPRVVAVAPTATKSELGFFDVCCFRQLGGSRIRKRRAGRRQDK